MTMKKPKIAYTRKEWLACGMKAPCTRTMPMRREETLP